MAVVIPLAFAAAGAWAGTAVGIGAAAGWAIGSAIGSVVEASFAPKTAPQNTLADLSVQTSNWGAGLPRVYGAQRLAGNIIWSTDKRMMGGSQGKFGGKGGGGGKGGKKGGGGQAYYEVSLAIALAEGPIYGIKRIWAAGDLIFDDSAPTYVPNYGQTGGSYQQYGSTTYADYSTGGSSLGVWTLYHGTDTQMPDATIAANGSNAGTDGVPYQQMTLQNGHEYTYGSPAFGKLGTACAYRGIAYIVFPNLYISESGSIPPLTFEVLDSGPTNPITILAQYDPGINGLPIGGAGISADGKMLSTVSWATHDPVNTNTNLDTGYQYALNQIYNGLLMSVPYGDGYLSANPSLGWYQHTTLGPGQRQMSAPIAGFNPGAYFVQYGKVCWVNGSTLYSFTPGYATSITYSYPLPAYAIPSKGWGGYQGTGSVSGYVVWAGKEIPTVNDHTYWFSGSSLIEYNGGDPSQIQTNLPSEPDLVWLHDGTLYVAILTGRSSSITTYDFYTVSLLGVASKSMTVTLSGSITLLQLIYVNGAFYAISGTNVYKFNDDGSTRYTLTQPLSLYSVYGYGDSINAVLTPRGIMVARATDLILVGYGDDELYYADPSLPGIVSSICDRAQFSNYDVSALDSSITLSLTIPAGSPARDVLSYISKIYQFDMVDSAGLLKFIPKGQAISGAIPIDDIGFVKESISTPPAPYLFSRAQGSDLPRSVTLKYMSRLANYTQNVRQFQINNPSGKDVTASVPMTLDDLTAANAAMLLCISPHIEKTAYSWSTSLKYLSIEPGDVWQMPWGVTRITQIAIDDAQQTPVIKMQGVIDATYVINNGYGMAEAVPVPELGVLPIQPAALASGAGSLINAPGSGSSGGNNGTLNKPPLNPGTAYGTFLEVPPLNSKQTSPYYLIYCYSTGSVFMGAAIFESTDGGSTFDQIGQQAVGGMSGFILEAIPNTQPFTWDNSTVLSAYLAAPYMTLSGATDLQVMNGANLMKVGDELIQFGNAALMTDAKGTPYYQLSRLLRGRRGTEWAMSTHIAGEQFTLIVDNEDVSVPYALTDLNAPNQFKVATAIQDISQIVPQSFAPTGVWFKPWTVANPLLSKDTSNNWNLTFVPRARLNGFLASGVISSLDPDTQTFSIDIYNGMTLKRTVTGQLSSPSFQYTAAMQAADGFSAGSSGIKFNIYQVGSQIGRGYVNTVTS